MLVTHTIDTRPFPERVNRMKRLLTTILLALPAPLSADQPIKMGMNLSGVADWSTEIVWVDAFKASRPWTSQADGQPYGKGGDLPLNDRGWPTKLAEGQFAEALMHVDIGDKYPGGKYVCLHEGKGELEFNNAASGKKVTNGRYDVTINPTRGMFAVRVRKTDAKDPVRNIRLIREGHEKTYGVQPFDPDFLKRYEGFSVLRFMDWQKTNNSKQVKWSGRAKMDDPTQTTDRGVALEYCLMLANHLKADPWLCLPHLADDDYVREFAKLVKSKLGPGRKVYVEYSNETWNTQFDQAKHCKAKGLELKLSDNPYEAQLRYSAQRSVEVFKIVEEVFGTSMKDKVVRVIAAQGANPWTGTTEMDWQDAYKSADAIAIAPYFGGFLGDADKADAVVAAGLDDLFEKCKKAIARNLEINQKYKAEADKRNLRLICYESGQHLAGHGGAENNDRLTELFHKANRDPRMGELYKLDYENWKQVGGDVNCVFASMGRWSKWGSWGVLEHHFQDKEEELPPKWAAVRAQLPVRKK